MEDWRREVVSDLRDAERTIESVLPEISGEPTAEHLRSVWRSYLCIEKSIVFVRVETGEENPGRFVQKKQFAVPDERQALNFALKNLKKGSESFALGDFEQALKELRTARNYLRVLLRDKRLMKTRTAKASRGRP